MAGVTPLVRDGREGFRVRFYDAAKRRREIYLPGSGRSVQRLAKAVAAHCDALVQAKGANVPADPAAIAWANGTEGRLRENLVAWGLADPVSPKLATDAGRYLGAFVDAYIESRTDVKESTQTNYKQTRRLLVEFFGDRQLLRSITAGDGARWRRWLSAERGLAVASCSKHTKRAKTLFAAAVADRLIAESPVAGLKGGDESNPLRRRFITPEVSARVLAACPDADWRLIFALARWCGLRCPSEVRGLRWSDVDWEEDRLRIESPKTGLRFCPIFAEVRPVLAEAFDLAPTGSEFCVSRHRGGLSNPRTQFGRILKRAGVVPWPKLFVNLRSTRRTELQEMFPGHVVDAWLGHSGAVAAKHYLQVTDEHWARASESRPPTSPPIVADPSPSAAITDIKKPRENPGFDGSGYLPDASEVTPTGLEPVLPP
ncbi:MAG: hypothetical protein EA381_13115 [Planctomycetaceae bacterium]|nr:MAG: hypothetical protein EA381_13115 [Planctomycetaceae bacterium]